MITKLKTHGKVVGTRQVRKAIDSSVVKTVFIADDAEEKVTTRIEELCNFKQIEIIRVDTMNELGDACGIGINAAVAALLK